MLSAKKEILKSGRIHITDCLSEIKNREIIEDILAGLRATPKYIPSKYFYDERGSELFEAITGLDEYYPTRTEKEIILRIGKELDWDFRNLHIIELGSGDSSKISLLLKQIPERDLETITYYPVDISQSAIEKSAGMLIAEFPAIHIEGLCADFIRRLDLIPGDGKRLFCFFGSTIGNLEKTDIRKFMQNLGKTLKPGENLLLGLDMIKDIKIIEKAYNDEQDITAEFNRNILNVVNNLINSDFHPTQFTHIAVYNKKKNRIEMYLEARKNMKVKSDHGIFFIKKGERIHTENSHKFSKEDIKDFGVWSGLVPGKIFTDEKQWFSIVLYRKANG